MGIIDGKYAATYGLFDRSVILDFPDWSARKEAAAGGWSVSTHVLAEFPRLKWVDGGWGALIHPRDQRDPASGYFHYCSIVVGESNIASGKGSAIGPACNLKDNGAGVVPDGYYCSTFNIGAGPKIRVSNVHSGGTVKTTLTDIDFTVLAGAVLTMSFQELNDSDPEHELKILVDGAQTSATIIVNPGNHLSASAVGYGVGGVNLGHTNTAHYTSRWQASGKQ